MTTEHRFLVTSSCLAYVCTFPYTPQLLVLANAYGHGPPFPHNVDLVARSYGTSVDLCSQVIRCADAGADLVRITVQGKREAKACKKIREQLNARVRTSVALPHGQIQYLYFDAVSLYVVSIPYYK